jgi:murein tripeptide amidase MpaA
MADIRFDTYYRYEDITRFLIDWAEKYSGLCRVDSLGQSYEGRDIWVVTLTNFDTGPDQEKPAYWVDGNIHATEVSASSAALYLIHKLLSQYGQDPKITHALDSRVFYIVPRLNPDGAEWALADRPRHIRSSTRPYPRTDRLDGLHAEDIDGDGRILQMRVKDNNGPWKIYPEDPRLMIPREPDDPPGEGNYRLFTEGMIQNYDGVIVKSGPALQGLDLNRQFPVFWHPSEKGAGAYPASEPETRAAVQFITDHPNITGSISFHTFSGVNLRPPTRGGDDTLPTQDLYTYQKIGQKGRELTGYPAVSVFDDFKYDPKEFIKGTFDDWMYEYLGTYSWTTEIWSVQRQAGIKDYKFIDWFRDHPLEDDLAILKWNDEVLGGAGYIDWYSFEHPQLGLVELGGWHDMYTWRNPPHALLEQEIAPLADFALFCALISPRLEMHNLEINSTGDIHTIRLVVHNTGWLPTNVSEKALESKTVREVEADIELPPEARLLSGQPKTMLGQLKGRDHQWRYAGWSDNDITDRAKVEWVVTAPAGTTIHVTVVHPRAGTVRANVALGPVTPKD